MTRRTLVICVTASAAAVAMAVGTGLVLAQREPVCARPSDAVRRLDLGRPDDRAHASADLTEIARAAQAFSVAVSRRPRISDSVDARAGAMVAPTRARDWCAAVLTGEMLGLHQVTSDALRVALAPAPARAPAPSQAEAVGASAGAPIADAVTSRPSR